MTLSNTRLEEPVSFPNQDDEWHSWLDGCVEQALQIREHIESLPDTAVTFKPTDIDVNTSIPKIQKCCKLAGSWKLPDTLTNNTNQKWVNPHATDAHRYSDAVVKCSCGVPMLQQKFSKHQPQPVHNQDHGDCVKADRLEARAQLLRNRTEIIKEAYEYGHTARGYIARLGFQNTRSVGGKLIDSLGLDLQKLGEYSRTKVAKTAMVLLREYNTTTVGALFGLSNDSIKIMIREETNADALTLYKHRRKYA